MTSAVGLRLPWIVAALCAAGFGALAVRVEVAGSMPGDERALVELHELIGTSWDDPMVAIGAATDSIVLAVIAALVVIWLVRRGRSGDAWRLAVVVGAVLVVNPLLKELFERPRPDVRPHPETVSTFSFPSGHAAGTAALAGAIVGVVEPRFRRTAITVGIPLVVLVGFSRLVTSVHYPSDVLAGWLWVAAWLLAVFTPLRKR